MEQTNVQKLAKVLRWLVALAFVCNIIALYFVPAIVLLSPIELFQGFWDRLLILLQIQPLGEDDIYTPMVFVALFAWQEMWREPTSLPYVGFLLLCGISSAQILYQARRVLDTILAGSPFVGKNAQALKSAAVCCWVISGAALLRMILEIIALKNPAPLITYNAAAVPIFFMGGLLFLVMSALFRQAAELQVNLDVMMAKRKMSLGELAQKVDITMANLSILKNNKARAVRFSTLEAICKALDCQPGDILEYVPDGET